MRLDRRFAIVVGFSLLWALVVSAIFYRIAAHSAGKRPSAPQKPLVVAAQPLPLGALLTPASLKLIQIPENLFPKGGFSRPEDVLERPVISPIQPDEPVVEARLGARGSGGGLAPLIPPGMRAISVRVNDVVGVSGFVLPGMRVDVLVTGRPPNAEDTVTTTVLQNIAVLSAGQTMQVEANRPAITVPVVTLLVNPMQAEALTLANNEGHIQLVLRNSTDQAAFETPGRRLHDIYRVERPAPAAEPALPRKMLAKSADRSRPEVVRAPPPIVAAPAPAVSRQAPPEGVLVIRGNQKTIETVEQEASQ